MLGHWGLFLRCGGGRGDKYLDRIAVLYRIACGRSSLTHALEPLLRPEPCNTDLCWIAFICRLPSIGWAFVLLSRCPSVDSGGA